MANLLECVKTGKDIERFHDLLNAETKQSLNIRHGDSGLTLLHMVAENSGRNLQKRDDFLRFARELISFSVNVNAGDKFRRTPLHMAVYFRDFNMIQLLLENNALVNSQDGKGNTALHYAATKAHFSNSHKHTSDLLLKIVKLLIKYEIRCNMRNRKGETALILAIRDNNFEIVQELLKNEASLNLRDWNYDYPMHHALNQHEVDVNIVIELRRRDASFTPENSRGSSPLALYIEKLKRTSSRVEMSKAKSVFKIFTLHYDLIEDQMHRLNEIRLANENECSLPEYIEMCHKEVKQMQNDELAPDCYVYDIALRGVFYALRKNDEHIPFGAFAIVISKLMNGEYPNYSEWIIEGICRSFLKERFAGACSEFQKRPKYFFNEEQLCLLSDYVSNVDMLNMMTACCKLSPATLITDTANDSVFSRIFSSFFLK